MRFWIILCFAAGSLNSFSQDYSLDKKLGEENSRLVMLEIGLYQHDSLQRLIDAVGQKLVSRLKSKPFEFNFYLADTEVANAFALPGGYIYVTRGILPLIKTEEELAGILAHEIIHVMQRHSVKQMQKQSVTSLLKVPGNLINAVTGSRLGNILNAPIEFATGSYIAKYSRGHEKESDSFGIQLAASAGYKTDALADALDRLSREGEVMTGEAEKRSYFSDHPYTPKRVSDVRKSANLYKPVNPSPTTTRQQFIRAINGLCFGPNPANGIFIDSLFVHPDMEFSWIVPPSWMKVNKPAIVAAYEEKGRGIIALRLVGNEKSPADWGKQMQDTLAKQKSIVIQHAGDTTINSNMAYIIRLISKEQDQSVIMEAVWVNLNNQVYQIIGMATPELISEVHIALGSFKKAIKTERTRVNLFTVRVVAAQQDESVEQLSRRAGNRLIPGLTNLYNETSNDQKLEEGQLIKIVNAQPYKN